MCKTVLRFLPRRLYSPSNDTVAAWCYGGQYDLVQQAAVVCGPRGCVHRPTLYDAGRYGTNGVAVVAATPGMDADPAGRGKVEDARPIDLVVRATDVDGEEGAAELTERRFPPPWFVEDIGAACVVKDSNGQQLADARGRAAILMPF